MIMTFTSPQAVHRILGDRVVPNPPITVEILLQLFRLFDLGDHLHVCMCALFLVAFFSFLRISNLVPYKLSDIGDAQA